MASASAILGLTSGLTRPAVADPLPPDRSCNINGEHRVCAYATSSGIVVAYAGDTPYFAGGDPVADVQLADGSGPDTNVYGSTDGRGYGTASISLAPGTYSVGLDALPVALNGTGAPIRSVTVTVPGTDPAPTAYPVPADLTPAADGFVEAGADGGVFNFGSAGFYGSMGGRHLDRPVVGIARTSDGGGYWLDAADGGVFAFGDAGYFGSEGGKPLARPVVGMAATPDGKGYWLVASDGGVFAFGDAGYFGSEGGRPLARPVVGMAATPDGKGYWLVASDGGVFAFGDAGFYGSEGGQRLDAPITGITAAPNGGGYLLAAHDGGIFAFGQAPFDGSATNESLPPVGVNPPTTYVPFVGITTTQTGGYALAFGNGIGYAAFESSSRDQNDGEAYGAMLGAPSSPVVAISS